MATQAEIAATVGKNIATVRDEKQKALDALRSQWFGGDASKNAQSAINSITTRIESWAVTGMTSAAINKAPGVTGWNGWTKSGRILIDGIHEIAEIGTKAALQDVLTTLKEVPKNAAKDVTAATTAVAGVVGATASALVTPLMGPLVIIVVVAIVLALIAHHLGYI
jgi:hypothetical protein